MFSDQTLVISRGGLNPGSPGSDLTD